MWVKQGNIFRADISAHVLLIKYLWVNKSQQFQIIRDRKFNKSITASTLRHNKKWKFQSIGAESLYDHKSFD